LEEEEEEEEEKNNTCDYTIIIISTDLNLSTQKYIIVKK